MTEQDNNNRPLEISLDPFYADILSKKFTTSVEAIDYCRKLCAHFGFTIKQEQSTYRNIYVYCSREGFPDSLRNPKSNPKRRRPSKRCDCRWRIVLNEQNEAWHFRKSLNPDASKHNHELMRPEEIDKGWPKEMLALICELARQRLPTPEIRTRVQLLYSHIPWNERRFYNRLSEERQKQRIRDAELRVQQLTAHWSNVVTVAAASQELTDVSLIDLRRLVDKLCGMTQTDSSTFPLPQVLHDGDNDDDNHDDDDNDTTTHHDDSTDDHYQPSQDPMETTTGDSSSQDESIKPSSSRKQGNKAASTHPDTPKGYTAVTVPQQVYYVKLHPHRVLQDVQQLHRRRSRSLAFSDDFNPTTTPDLGTTPQNDDPTVFSNQLKKQKTPMLMEMAQQQPSDMLSARPPPPSPFDAQAAAAAAAAAQQHFQPPPPHPDSGLMYHRDYYPSSTSYPVVYQQQQQQTMMPPPPPTRFILDNHHRQQPTMSSTVYTTGRPPLLSMTPDFQQHQQPMTPTPPSPNRMAPLPPPSSTTTTTTNESTTTPSPKGTTPHDQQPPPPAAPPPQQYMIDHRASAGSLSSTTSSFYRPPPYQQPQDAHHHQRLYYSNLPPQLLPTTAPPSSQHQQQPPPPGMYYMKQPHLPPSQ